MLSTSKNWSVFYRFTVITPLYRFVLHQTLDTNCVAECIGLEPIIPFSRYTRLPIEPTTNYHNIPNVFSVAERFELSPAKFGVSNSSQLNYTTIIYERLLKLEGSLAAFTKTFLDNKKGFTVSYFTVKPY